MPNEMRRHGDFFARSLNNLAASLHISVAELALGNRFSAMSVSSKPAVDPLRPRGLCLCFCFARIWIDASPTSAPCLHPSMHVSSWPPRRSCSNAHAGETFGTPYFI
jgi:hypothetical protein